MALSDVATEKERKRPNRALEASTNKRWSDKQKLEAVNTYLVLGNLALTSRMLGIPEITLRVWKASEWWREVVEDIKTQERVELSNRLKKIVEAAHGVVENRLVNGDPVLNQKTGEIVMKPVAMKDAHRVAVDLLNQKEAVERANKPAEQKVSSNDDKLKQLAERFAEFAVQKVENMDKRKPLPYVEIVDVVDKNEERAHAVAQDDPISDAVLSGDISGVGEVGEEESSIPPEA